MILPIILYPLSRNDPIDQRLNMNFHCIQAWNRAHFVIQQQRQFRTAQYDRFNTIIFFLFGFSGNLLREKDWLRKFFSTYPPSMTRSHNSSEDALCAATMIVLSPGILRIASCRNILARTIRGRSFP